MYIDASTASCVEHFVGTFEEMLAVALSQGYNKVEMAHEGMGWDSGIVELLIRVLQKREFIVEDTSMGLVITWK